MFSLIGAAACGPAQRPVATAADVPSPATAPAPEPDEPEPAEPTLPEALVRAAEALTAAAEDHSTSWQRLTHMTDTFGPRLSGSKALEQAIDWSLGVMIEDGLSKVRREPVMVPRWVRGREWAKVVAPVERELVLLGIGGTVGTGGEPLRGEVEVVGDLAELDRRAEELRGRVVLVNQAMGPYDPEERNSHYGEVAEIRYHGPARAARHGVQAYLIRSLTARSLRTPHTGSLSWGDDPEGPRVPAAALTVEDAELLARLRRRGPVTVELFLDAETLPDAPSGNAIGEIPGRELPGEVVVLGAHSDSWDVGDGAADDAAGCVMVLEAARLLQTLGLTPRRTIRVVLFTNEENGMRGALAYHETHGDERHVAALEADAGAGEPQGFSVQGGPEQLALLEQLAPLFEGLGADQITEGHAGVDIRPLIEDGVLGVGLSPDGSAYFDVHHSPADTVDHIDPRFLQRNAAAMALMAFALAELDLADQQP